MKKISILIPIYGVEKFIAQCAKSIFEQTYEDIEYIFVDDCTPDNSVKVLEDVLANYPNRLSHVKIIHHEKNRGSGAARLTGMQHATGDLIMFVDSDDYIAEDCVAKLVTRQAETGADIVDGGFSTFSGEQILSTTPPINNLSDVNYLRAILIHNTIKHQIWARVFRKKIFEEYDVQFVEGINYAEDYSIMCRLLPDAHRETIDDIIYYYRYNDYGTFSDGATLRHFDSVLRANALVCKHLGDKVYTNKYAYATQLGVMDLCCYSLHVGVPISKVYNYCGKPSNFIIRFLLLFHAFPFSQKLLRLSYLILKRVYRCSVLHI